MFLQAVHLGYIRGGDPSYPPLDVGSLTPIPVFALARHFQFVSLLDGQLAGLIGIVAVLSYVQIRIVFICAGSVQEVLQRAPAVAVSDLRCLRTLEILDAFIGFIIVAMVVEAMVSSIRCKFGKISHSPRQKSRGTQCTHVYTRISILRSPSLPLTPSLPSFIKMRYENFG